MDGSLLTWIAVGVTALAMAYYLTKREEKRKIKQLLVDLGTQIRKLPGGGLGLPTAVIRTEEAEAIARAVEMIIEPGRGSGRWNIVIASGQVEVVLAEHEGTKERAIERAREYANGIVHWLQNEPAAPARTSVVTVESLVCTKEWYDMPLCRKSDYPTRNHYSRDDD